MALAVEEEDAHFQSKLDKASREIAREELNEVEADRLGAVQAFRNLVLQEKWLRTPTEFSFLLRFLRARKFSQLLAKETLQNYWTVKTKFPEWFADLDPADKTLQEIMRTCFYFSPMKHDKWGRRIVIEQMGNLDIDFMKKAFGVDSVFRTLVLIAEWINRDENVQVNGICALVDCTNISIKHHLHLWTFENIKKMLQYYEKALPSRMKGFYVYNEPPFFDAVWTVASSLMREKTKSRLSLHGKNLATVYDHVDKSVLPDEYLPDDYTGPSAGKPEQIVEDMIADMMTPEFRNYILELSSKKYGVDLEKQKQSLPTVASFRKLTID